jgi:hypothetical protein
MIFRRRERQTTFHKDSRHIYIDFNLDTAEVGFISGGEFFRFSTLEFGLWTSTVFSSLKLFARTEREAISFAGGNTDDITTQSHFKSLTK